jgi:hypothetical protein
VPSLPPQAATSSVVVFLASSTAHARHNSDGTTNVPRGIFSDENKTVGSSASGPIGRRFTDAIAKERQTDYRDDSQAQTNVFSFSLKFMWRKFAILLLKKRVPRNTVKGNRHI